MGKLILMLLGFWIICIGNISLYSLLTAILVTFMVISIAVYIRIVDLSFIKLQFNMQRFIYFFWLFKEIIMSTLLMLKTIWSFHREQPLAAFIKVPITSKLHTDLSTTIYTHSITLTPGTYTVNATKNYLIVHTINQKFVDNLQVGIWDYKIAKLFGISK